MKRKAFALFVLLSLFPLCVLARNAGSVSLGGYARYASQREVNFGVNVDLKLNHFSLSADLLMENRIERLTAGLYIGFLPYYDNDIGEDFHSFTTQILFGSGFEFDFRSFRSYYAFTPSCRLAIGWTFPCSLEIRAVADVGVCFSPSSSSSSFHYSVGGVLSYSFDVGKAPYRYRPYKYYQYEE